ncbi:MAG: beta strand repeat-containing protein [Opitutaceae bacterium]
MNYKTLSNLSFVSLCSVALCVVSPSAWATQFYWDHSDSAHWGRSSNWNSGGAGGHPSSSGHDAYLVYNGMGGVGGQGVGENNMDLKISDNDSSTVNFSTRIFYIATNASNHDWVLDNDGSTGNIKVFSGMYFDLAGGGSAVINSNLEVGDSFVSLKGTGNRAILNGQLIGDNSAVLSGESSGTRPNGNSISGGGLELRATTNDSFTGTIRPGVQTVKITQVNGLRYAIVEMHEDDAFEYPSGAVIGALGGDSDLTLSGTLTVGNNNRGTTFTGALKGSGNIIKTGSAVWELGGNGTHTGNFYLSSGRIRMQNNGGYNTALKDSNVYINVDDGLYFNGGDVNVGGLDGSKEVNIGANTLLIDGGFDSFHKGKIYGAGVLEINTSGSQALASANTYSGGTRLLGGTLIIDAPSDLGNDSGALTMGDATFNATNTHTQSRALHFYGSSANAVFDVKEGKYFTWGGAINDSTGGQTIQKIGAGRLSFSNDSNLFNGLVDVDEGIVRVTTTAMEHAEVNLGVDNGLALRWNTALVGALTGSGDITIDSGKTLSVGSSDADFTYSGDISGSGSFNKVGAGRLVYSGNSTLTGTTNVEDGAFVLSGNVSSSSIANVVVDSGAAMWGTGRSSGSLTINGTVAPYSTLRANAITLNGSYDCEVSGASSDKLQADASLDVSSGTLALQFPSGAPSQAAYVLANYGTLIGKFSSVNGLPSGYKIDYAYSGSNIAMVKDTTAPKVASNTPVTSSPTGGTSAVFTVVFDEAVLGFNSFADLVVNKTGSANATGATFSTADNITHTVTLTGVSGDGDLSLGVVLGANVTDEALNNLVVSVTSSVVEVDTTAPTVASITPVTTSPTNSASVSFTVVFDEAVNGFDSFADLNLGKTGTVNATAATFSTADNITHTVTLTDVVGDGDLTLGVVVGSNVEDLVGLDLESSVTSAAVEVDNTRPTITSFTMSETSPSSADSIVYGITFSEPVSGFVDSSDLYFSGVNATVDKNDASVVNAGDDKNYTVTLNNISGNGSLVFRPAIDQVNDQVGLRLEDNSSIYSPEMVIDNIAPQATIISRVTSSPSSSDSVIFSVSFNEDVTGFDSFADLVIGKTGTANATGATFSTVDDQTYTVTLTNVSGDGGLTIGVVTGSGVQDFAGHNLASSVTSDTMAIDNSAPSVASITPITSSPTTDASVGFTVVFDEAVAGFDNFADLVVGKTESANATGATFSSVDNITHTVTLTGVSGDGDLTLGVVPSAGVQDLVGQSLGSSVTSSAVTVDNTAPGVASITPITASPTNSSSISFTVVFDETVTGFNSFTDLDIGSTGTVNAPAAAFSTSDNISYTVTLNNVMGDGDLTLAVMDGLGVQDQVGKGLVSNLISVTSSPVTVDNTAPTVASITSVTSSPTNADVVSFTVVFNEAVSGFDSFADLSVGTTETVNATAATFGSVDDTTYTVTLTSVTGDGELTLGVVTGSGVQDAVAHGLSASVASSAVIVDHTAPVIALVGAGTIEHQRGGTWTDPGYSATDSVDGSVSVTVGGDSVDAATLGQYVITYDATDAAGNTAERKTRTVNVVNAAPIYVNAAIQGEAPEDGLSWGSAYAHLQDALSATQAGVVQSIYVAKGVYYPDVNSAGNSNSRDAAFVIPSGVQLYGGFSGSNGEQLEDRNLSLNETVLSGDIDQNDGGTDASGVLTGAPQSSINGGNSRNLVVFEDASGERILDGVTLTAAQLDGSSVHGGGALRIEGGSVIVRDCQLIGNWNVYDSWNETYKGSGLAVSGGAVSLDRCTISNNYATSDYAGLLQNGGNLTFSNGWIESNQATNGAGVTTLHGSLLIENSFIRGQQAIQSGAGVLIRGFVTLHNTVISGNAAGQNGGGIWIESPAADLTTINVTIAGNQAGFEGGGLQSTECYNVNLSNTIISQNTAFVGSTDNIGLTYGAINAYTSLLTGVALTVPGGSGGSSGGSGSSGGTGGGPAPGQIIDQGGCFNAGTEFVAAESAFVAPTLAGDYSLVSDSFGIDLGSNFAGWDADSADLSGDYRIVDGDFSGSAAIDMGAYEYQGFALQEWRRQYGLDVYGANDNDVLADDGLTALMKYAFNLGDPYVTTVQHIDLDAPEAGGLPVLSEVDDVLTFSYIQPVSVDDSGDVFVEPEASTTLDSDSWEYWGNFDELLYDETVEVLEGGEYQLHQIKIDFSKGDQVFFRCRVGFGV